MLTLLAIIFTASSVLIWLPQDPGFKEEFPMWTYIWGAFCIFMYQTLDAVDGKQARRTKQSGPLGQLFDHGCDAVNTFFGGFIYYQGLRVESTWGFFAMILGSSVSHSNNTMHSDR